MQPTSNCPFRFSEMAPIYLCQLFVRLGLYRQLCLLQHKEYPNISIYVYWSFLFLQMSQSHPFLEPDCLKTNVDWSPSHLDVTKSLSEILRGAHSATSTTPTTTTTSSNNINNNSPPQTKLLHTCSDIRKSMITHSRPLSGLFQK